MFREALVSDEPEPPPAELSPGLCVNITTLDASRGARPAILGVVCCPKQVRTECRVPRRDALHFSTVDTSTKERF